MTVVLVDRRNVDIIPSIVAEVTASMFNGIDIETCQPGARPGIVAMNKKGYVADLARTIITGFSIYCGGERRYYFNLWHADAENRLTFEEVAPLFSALPQGGQWLCHNAQYEIAMFEVCLGVVLSPVICTMQMAVSAYGPDQYSIARFSSFPLLEPLIVAEHGSLLPRINQAFIGYDMASRPQFDSEQAELFGKVLGKESDAAHSYNGMVKRVAFGYGLKQAVKSFFDVDMTTFKQCLGTRAHMGELTGEETAAYGADDAYWCYRLFFTLLEFMQENCPESIKAFFEQENPMVPIYARKWVDGVRLDREQLASRYEDALTQMATALRRLKAAVREALPFSAELSPHLEDEKWYTKPDKKGNLPGFKYRKRIENWATSPDSENDVTQVTQVSGSMSAAWISEGKSNGPNITHYMVMRTIIYDLLDEKPITKKGAIQSDGEARGKLIDRRKKKGRPTEILEAMAQISTIEQAMKLYLVPYRNLVDPDTGLLHPQIMSMLATRRMSMTNPNGQQLAKRSESVWVRSFYEADTDEHVILSADWNSIELVIPAELSGDPAMVACFSQVPYDDLHSGAAASVLSVEVPGLTAEMFKSFKFLKEGQEKEIPDRLLINLKGEKLPASKVYGYWRTEVGKKANFNYWFSGWLGTIGEVMGWSQDRTAEATEAYRQLFPVAEAWRVRTVDEVVQNGYVTLPDGHRRTRFEATRLWADIMRIMWSPWADYAGIRAFSELMIKRTQSRAKNQAVNAKVQGSAAALMKRSWRRLEEQLGNAYMSLNRFERALRGSGARVMFPIHDELLVSCHKSEILEVRAMMREAMLNHPDLFSKCRLNCSVAMGRNFGPYDPVKNPHGQIELDEAPALAWTMEGKAMNDNQILETADYLFKAA